MSDFSIMKGVLLNQENTSIDKPVYDHKLSCFNISEVFSVPSPAHGGPAWSQNAAKIVGVGNM